MVYASRGNKVRRIDEFDIPKYIEQGYNITDDSGKVLQQAVPTDIAVLRKSFVTHTNQISILQAQIDELKAKNATLEAELAKAKTTSKKVVEEVKPQSEDDIAKAEEALNRPRKSRTKAESK